LAFLSNALIPVPLCLSFGCGSAGTPLSFLCSFVLRCFSLFSVFNYDDCDGAFLAPWSPFGSDFCYFGLSLCYPFDSFGAFAFFLFIETFFVT